MHIYETNKPKISRAAAATEIIFLRQTKLDVACTCKARPPIDVRVKVVGPWKE